MNSYISVLKQKTICSADLNLFKFNSRISYLIKLGMVCENRRTKTKNAENANAQLNR